MKPLSGMDLAEPAAAEPSADLARRQATPTLATARPAAASSGRQTDCGDFGLRIARDGTWFYHGSPILRKPLVRLFATVLQRDEVGDYWLVTPAERGRITVDDAPFIAQALEVAGAGEDQVLRFVTNVDDHIIANMQHPIRVVEDAASGAPSPYILVRDRLEARISRAVFYQLADLAVAAPGGERLGVWSAGSFFDLGPAA